MEHLISTWGYLAILLLSIAQSACVPTSSELTFGFAGFLAYEGHFNILAVVIVGAVGELIGAYIAWAFGITGGRALVLRYGRLIRVEPAQLDRLEAWYARHPRWGVFASRLLPVVRNFVALAAGLAEVPPVLFGVLTFLGSLVWDGGLTLLGYSVGSAWARVAHTVSDAGYLAVALIVLIVAGLYLLHRRAAKGTAEPRRAHTAAGSKAAAARQPRPRRPQPARRTADDPTGYLGALARLARARAVTPEEEA
jgi:membrane protein DedA with SNARE-associated domain